MTFLEIIEEIHRKDQGVTSGALAGVDGLTVEEWRAPGDDRDLAALCAEAVRFFQESDRIAVDDVHLHVDGALGLADGFFSGQLGIKQHIKQDIHSLAKFLAENKLSYPGRALECRRANRAASPSSRAAKKFWWVRVTKEAAS